MRRLLLAAAVAAAAVVGVTPGTSSAAHYCNGTIEELVCFVGCPRPPKICPVP